MFRMLLRSRRYAGQFFKRRSWDLSTPPKVPNPYGAGYTCIAPPIATERRPFPGHPSIRRVVNRLLFESQAERSRPWFAQVHASGRGLTFSLQSYAELFSLHWVPSDGAVLARLGEWHPAGTV